MIGGMDLKVVTTCKKHYGIVVIGAGPAGCNFARLVDSKKYTVLVVDGSERKGEKVCGGLLSPDAQDLFAKYDISLPKDVLVSPQLFSVRTIDLELDQIRYYRRSYMNLNRAKFDRFMLEMLPDQMDVVRASCKSVVRKGSMHLLELQAGTETIKVTCDYLVGADGASSVVRRCLFPKEKIQRYVSIQQWFPAEKENPYYSCVFDHATSPSCSWIFFKDGYLVFGGAFEPWHCRGAFEEQKRKLVERGIVPSHVFNTPAKTEACMVSRPHITRGIYRGDEKAFLLGEAAGFISPSSFEGISYALASGEALAKAFGKGQNQKQIYKKYCRKTAKLRLKVWVKCAKHPFMFQKMLRTLILKSGIGSMNIRNR